MKFGVGIEPRIRLYFLHCGVSRVSLRIACARHYTTGGRLTVRWQCDRCGVCGRPDYIVCLLGNDGVVLGVPDLGHTNGAGVSLV